MMFFRKRARLREIEMYVCSDPSCGALLPLQSMTKIFVNTPDGARRASFFCRDCMRRIGEAKMKAYKQA